MQLSAEELFIRAGHAIDPPEKQVRHGLHQPLAAHDPLPFVLDAREFTHVFHIGREHGGLRFLELEDDPVVGVAAFEERDEAPRADAAQANHLPCKIDDLVAAGDDLVFRRKRFDECRIAGFDIGPQRLILEPLDHGRLLLEAGLPINLLGEPGDRSSLGAVASFLERGFGVFCGGRRISFVSQPLDVVRSHPFVEHSDGRLPRKLLHGLAVGVGDMAGE